MPEPCLKHDLKNCGVCDGTEARIAAREKASRHARLRRLGSPGPGPWFPARFPGECSAGGCEFDVGETIRADGDGGWECLNCEAPEGRPLVK